MHHWKKTSVTYKQANDVYEITFSGHPSNQANPAGPKMTATMTIPKSNFHTNHGPAGDQLVDRLADAIEKLLDMYE